MRLSEEKAFDVLCHAADGCGVRQTGRLCHVQEETVIRLTRRVGKHFKRWHEHHVQGVTVREAKLDEKWSFVGKNKKGV